MPSSTIALRGGEEYESHQYQRHALGTKAVSQDGRVFRYAEMGGTAGVPGKLYQTVVPIANHTNIACDVARAAGATQISATDGGTGADQDVFAEGYVYINDANGEGYTYKVAGGPQQAAGTGNAEAGSGAVITVNLAPGYTVQTALTTSSEVTFHRNRYKAVILSTTGTTAPVVGLGVSDVTANYFCWLQTGGPAAVLTDGTVVIAQHVRSSDGTAGSVEALDRDGTHENEQEIGVVMHVNATTEYSLVDLSLDRG
jgi:hypothetical protein